MAGLQSDAVASRTPHLFVRTLAPIKAHWDVLINVRNLINELESRKLDFEDIGTLNNEDLPSQGEFFLTLTLRGDSCASVTRMGLENGRLYMNNEIPTMPSFPTMAISAEAPSSII